MLTRANTTAASSSTAASSRFGSHFGYRVGGYNDVIDTDHSSINETIDDDDDMDEGQEWGLAGGMELFEVSAKDETGIPELFDSLIQAIMVRKDSIDRENELKRRDSVFLSPTPTPTWAAQADEEEAREKARSSGSWSCCQS